MPLEIILDVSRLLYRSAHPTPSGIDRVEMAYAKNIDSLVDDRLAFCAFHPIRRRYCRLDRVGVLARLEAIESAWSTGSALNLGAAERLGWGSVKATSISKEKDRRPVIVKVSPDHLAHPRHMKDLVESERAPLVLMIHDLLPIQFPEFSGRGARQSHEKRLKVAAQFASHIIANSQDTAKRLNLHFGAHSHPPITAVPLGFASSGMIAGAAACDSSNADLQEPYFVCVGTIEPRKNHMLLLHLWRELSQIAAAQGDLVPKLYLVGRRGWENENIIDLLERSPPVRAHVIEVGDMGDEALGRLLLGARALLAPSFAEGFDLPVAEALALGVPVICSAIDPHREIGGAAPEYAHPLDGPTWLRLIREFSQNASPARDAQLRRLKDWSIRSWYDHLVEIHEICSLLGNKSCQSMD